MKNHTAKSLIRKYLQGEATPEERSLLEQWFQKDLENSDYYPSEERIAAADKAITANLMRHVLEQSAKSRTIRLWPRIAAAASIIFCLVSGAYFFFHKKDNQRLAQNHDILPGGNKATLTLANGKKIILNKVGTGIFAVQGSAGIKKTRTGEIIFQANSKPNMDTATAYNSVAIPRGGEYQEVILSDGTKVWINSASALRFPAEFKGNDRKVELSGEAYFEVAHNAAKPFRVFSHGQAVEVIGTHFDINAYDDEPAIKTTLLEGRVKVTSLANNEVHFLEPGQQSSLGSNAFTVGPSETEETVAWKNGRFMFNNDNIRFIMRAISRWYNVDVEYSGAIPDDSFNGETSRFKDVSEVLTILQLTGKVHFKIEGRKLIVSK